ncbi:unnamed protein product [Oikopleura dioica]|uniref:Reverse transcriptase domain-containing protein n=1 Tax=Oikopleura dioica TaxID=34765 RepID=E4XYJ8_OIKDI|nr:unnamed protein product [Oikopleura dioica]
MFPLLPKPIIFDHDSPRRLQDNFSITNYDPNFTLQSLFNQNSITLQNSQRLLECHNSFDLINPIGTPVIAGLDKLITPISSTPSLGRIRATPPQGELNSPITEHDFLSQNNYNHNNISIASPINIDITEAVTPTTIRARTNSECKSTSSSKSNSSEIIIGDKTPPIMDNLDEPPGFTSSDSGNEIDEEPLSDTLEDPDKTITEDIPVFHGIDHIINKTNNTNNIAFIHEAKRIISDDNKNMEQSNVDEARIRVSSGVNISESTYQEIAKLDIPLKNKHDIISDPDFQLSKFIKIKSLQDLQKRLREVTGISNTLKKKLEQIRADRNLWIGAVHMCCNQGTIALDAFLKDANSFTGNLKGQDECIEKRHLQNLHTALKDLSIFYQNPRAVSELLFLGSTLIYHLLPIPQSLSSFTILTFVSKKVAEEEVETINFVTELPKRRALDMGIWARIVKSDVLIFGMSKKIEKLPKTLHPIVGKNEKVINFNLGIKEIETLKYMLSACICGNTLNDPKTFDIINSKSWTQIHAVAVILKNFLRKAENKNSFPTDFITKPTEFKTPAGPISNRIASLRRQRTEENLNHESDWHPEESLNSAVECQDKEQDTKRFSTNDLLFKFLKKIPKEPIAIIKRQYPLFNSQILIRKDAKELLSNNLRNEEEPERPRYQNPTELNELSPEISFVNTTINSSSVSCPQINMNNFPSQASNTKDIFHDIPIKMEFSNENIKKMEMNLKIINSRLVESEESNLKIMNANLGQITDSYRLRLIADLHPEVDVFCLNELFWERDQALCKTNWPQDTTIITHDKLGSSSKIYSVIMYRNERVINPRQIILAGVFTGLAVGEKEFETLIATTYRFNDRRENCLYNRYLKADNRIFLEWTKVTIKQAIKYKEFHMLGDLNFELPPRANDPKFICSEFDKIMGSFVNIISWPTHFRNNSRPSQIDVAYTNDPFDVKVEYLNLHQEPMKLDGHRGMIISTRTKRTPIPYELHCIHKLGSRSQIFSEAMKQFEQYEIDNDFDSQFQTLVNILKATQTKELVIKKPPKLDCFNFSAGTWVSINAYNNIKSLLPEYWKKSRHGRKQLETITRIIKKMKKQDELNYGDRICGNIEENKNRVWDLYKNLTGPPPICKITQSPNKLAQRTLKLQTDTITTDHNYKGPPFCLNGLPKLKNIPISFHGDENSPSFLSEYLKLTPHTKGAHGLSRKFLDLLPTCFFITHLYLPEIKCCMTGEYPKTLKLSRVTILPKKGNAIRPISIASPACTLHEKMIAFSLNPYLEDVRGYPPEQNGFRRSLGCLHSLSLVIDKIIKAVDEGKICTLSLVDCRNAFGVAGHGSLTNLIKKFSEGSMRAALVSSLERNFIVVKNGIASRQIELQPYGVPQGAVLAPSIFSLYISQIMRSLGSNNSMRTISLFADDCALATIGNDHQEVIEKTNQYLNDIANELEQMDLALVPEKTCSILFGKNLNEDDFKLGPTIKGKLINYTNSVKYLGTTISTDKGTPNFEQNSEMLIAKTKCIVNRTRSLRNILKKPENCTILRSTTLGAIAHNCEVLPKFSFQQNIRFNNLFYAGIMNSYSSAWWFKHASELNPGAKAKNKRISNALSIAKLPTNYLCRISAFTNGISKTLIDRRSERMRSVLFDHLELYEMSTGNRICPVPDLVFYERENRRRKRLHERQQITFTSLSVRDIDKFIIRCVTDMLNEGIISMRFNSFPNKKTLDYKLNWPWNFASDFNELPSFLRAKTCDKFFKNTCKRYFCNKHPHVMQRLNCDNTCTESRITLPPDALDFNRIKLNDDEDNVRAKTRLRLETEIFTVANEERETRIFESATGGLTSVPWLNDISMLFFEQDHNIFFILKQIWEKYEMLSNLFKKDLAHSISHETTE